MERGNPAEFRLDFDSNSAFETLFQEGQSFQSDFEDKVVIPRILPATTTTIGGVIVGDGLSIDEQGVLTAETEKSHTALLNRDAPDQHPIGAITRLSQELDSRPADALTNMDIYEIMN